MSILKCLLLICLVSQISAAAHTGAHCPGNAASLTLRLVHNALIVVPIEINHSGPYDFVVDTGAQITTIEPGLASELNLKDQGTTGVAGVATFARVAYTRLDLITAGTHSVANAIVLIQEMAQLQAADAGIRGVLGSNFLQHFDVLIDNSQGFICLDDSGLLSSAVEGEHIALAEPRGSQRDLPFMRPLLVSARVSPGEDAPILLRIDSGSNVPLLYAEDSRLRKEVRDPKSALTRHVNGVEQSFAMLPPRNIRIGNRSMKQVSFAVPLNAAGSGPRPREDGLLPTIVFQRVFISCSGGYVSLDPLVRQVKAAHTSGDQVERLRSASHEIDNEKSVSRE